MPATAALTGISVAPASLAATPGSADFGVVPTRGSKDLAFTLRNTGGTATERLTLSVTDDEFTLTSDLCTGLPLAANAQCTFTVTFTPTEPFGVKQALVCVAQGGGAPAAISQLSGTAYLGTSPPKLLMTPPWLDFGTTAVGAPVGPMRFTVVNLSSSATTGPFSVIKNDSTSSAGGATQFTFSTTCSAALPPAGSCQIDVTFAPTTAGTSSAVFSASDGTNSAWAPVTGQAL